MHDPGAPAGVAARGDTAAGGIELPGNVGGAVLIGDRVHRPTGPWTPAVHALLTFLQDRVPSVPRVHGVDDAGREVLTYLPGEVIDLDRERLTPVRIAALARWTRLFHDRVATFRHPGPWRYFPVPGATIIGHNDIAPYNACFAGDRLTGVFDWDLAGPTTPLFEVAFLAWNCVPLWRDDGIADATQRLRIIADAYAGPGPREILDAVPPRIEIMLSGIPAAAAAGDAGMAALMRQGEPERSRRSLEALRTRLPAVRAALG